jgi:hypothetical protein
MMAVVIFAVASPAAAWANQNAARQNAGEGAYQSAGVNAGVFTGRAGGIAAEPSSSGTPGNGLCAGNWGDAVSNVLFERARTGTLTWGFVLTRVARDKLGSRVEVTMPFAFVNNKSINPPYSPHIQSSGYNFRSSLRYYQFIRSRARHVIKTGDKIILYWVIFGSTGEDAYRYIRCTIPRPGSN